MGIIVKDQLLFLMGDKLKMPASIFYIYVKNGNWHF